MKKTWLRTISLTKRHRIAVRCNAIALAMVASVAFQNAALAQTEPRPVPNLGVLTAVTRCLTGEGCARRSAGTESAPASVCVADETLKRMSEPLRAKIRAFAKSKGAARCNAAEKTMAPLSEEIRNAYERGSTSILTPELVAAAHNYVEDCLSPDLLSDAGALTKNEQAYLRRVTGLIVERDPKWGGPRPICTAVAMGRFIITARSCLPPDATEHAEKGSYLENIAFRFFKSPTLYGLALHRFGSELVPYLDPAHDFALLETVAAPELWQPQGSVLRMGTMRLNEDLFALTTNVFLRVASGIRRTTKFELPQATRIHHNVLCRPAYIAPNGLFLHACRMTSVVTRGAPLFQRQNGQLVFVGIHSGATKSLADRSLASCAPGLPSYGIAIPPAIIARAFLK